MKDCIFCKIIAGEIPSAAVYEDGMVYAFRDISPAAPVHVLAVPKQHIADVAAIDGGNSGVLPAVYEAIAKIARQEGLTGGYRVVSNVGEDAGQTVPHLHFHILGGAPLGLMCGEISPVSGV